MTTKYCSSCSTVRNIEGGQVVSYKSSDRAIRTRWKCRWCVTKTAQSVYSKKASIKRPVNVAISDEK